MSCIGVYKRNVVTFFETSRWLDIMYVLHYINPIFMAFIKVQGHLLTKESIFWAWNIRGFGTTLCLYFLLPLCLTFPGECKLPEKQTIFYLRKTEVLRPRNNSFAGEHISFGKTSTEKSNRFSYLTKPCNKLNHEHELETHIEDHNSLPRAKNQEGSCECTEDRVCDKCLNYWEQKSH